MFHSSQKKTTPRPRSASLRLEKLEERAMFNADMSLSRAGVLTINGGQYADEATVDFRGSCVYVTMTHQLNAAGTKSVTENEKFEISKVGSIVFNGNAGNDRLTVNAAPSGVSVGGMKLEFNGGTENDTLDNRSSLPTRAEGGAGADTLIGGSGNDVLSGGDGSDFINGREGDDSLGGGEGVDRIYGGAGVDIIQGGIGNDYLFGEGDRDNIYGDDGIDTIDGGSGDDYLYGGQGNDYLYGREGNDTIWGDAGQDYLFGDNGDDWLYGGTENDVLYGGRGADNLFGEDGNDYLVGGQNFDQAGYAISNTERDLAVDILTGGYGDDTFERETARNIYNRDINRDKNKRSGEQDREVDWIAQ
jgi:Ca2+-binding RTX toxin-like protein